VRHLANLRTPQVGIAQVDRILQGLGEHFGGIKRGVFNNLDERFDFSRWLALNPSVRHALFGRYTQVEAGLGLVEHDFTRAIRETTAPTTVIWGGADAIAPLRTGRLLAARMPDARLKVIEGVGHTPMLESADTFRALLQEALVSPLSPRPAVTVSDVSQGDVVCQGEANRVYSGRFDSLTLDGCPGAQIRMARMKRLVVKASSVVIEDAVIDADDVALLAVESDVTATHLSLTGRVAIRSDNSRFDLAGASLRAREQSVEMLTPSRFLFSVSDWRGRDHTGDAHFPWPDGAAAPQVPATAPAAPATAPVSAR
jgi:hypothetical protein